MTVEFSNTRVQTNATASTRGTTLRAELDQARTQAEPFELREAVALIVPLCVQVAELHAAGTALRLHPSNVRQNGQGGLALVHELALQEPVLPADTACVAPELKPGQPGNARASVYAVGAMLYELLTLESVGPGMRRPRDVDPELPAALEAVLGKALVTNPNHRPDDLYALAQAIHHLAPPGTVPPPPPADESHLDHAGDFEVDVSLSLLPPVGNRPKPELTAGLNVGVIDRQPLAAPTDVATQHLAALKTRLQADTHPHYVVVKDGMDHGPFTSVELLQQIAANSFVEQDEIRDTISGKQAVIQHWEEFAPFADHARRHRDIKEEKEAIVRVVRQESKATQGKAFAGVMVFAVLLLGAGAWFLTQRGMRRDDVAVHTDNATNIEAEGNLNVPQKAGGRRVTGTQNGIPMLAGGMSCEGAQAAYVEEIKMGGGGQADITGGQYASVMNSGGYFSNCGVPSSTSIKICAAVQNGRAVGVTVSTSPSNPKYNQCITAGVRSVKFPAHPKLDVVRVSF